MKKGLILLLIISLVFTLQGNIFCQEDPYISEYAPNEEYELVLMEPVFKREE